MIQNDDILNMNFYKKEKFTGSHKGLRFRMEKCVTSSKKIRRRMPRTKM